MGTRLGRGSVELERTSVTLFDVCVAYAKHNWLHPFSSSGESINNRLSTTMMIFVRRPIGEPLQRTNDLRLGHEILPQQWIAPKRSSQFGTLQHVFSESTYINKLAKALDAAEGIVNAIHPVSIIFAVKEQTGNLNSSRHGPL